MRYLLNTALLLMLAAFALTVAPFALIGVVGWKVYRAAELRFGYDGNREQRERDEYNSAWEPL